MNTNRKGFTLIELLVVVLIIGILASIAIPQYFKVVERARVSEAMSIISNVKSAQERYLSRGGSYANTFDVLDISYAGLSPDKIETKFYDATLEDVISTGEPSYNLILQRRTSNSTKGGYTGVSVAGMYNTYKIKVSVPGQATPFIDGGNNDTNSLLN